MDCKGLLYEGVRQARTICVRQQYVLNIFQVASNTTHNIHWILHTIGRPKSQKTLIALEPSHHAVDSQSRIGRKALRIYHVHDAENASIPLTASAAYVLPAQVPDPLNCHIFVKVLNIFTYLRIYLCNSSQLC